ncbi:MAG: GNAT family N-acetyltransferase, partial [Actinomycetia bacterium]|nr:GNAT family N-acetyltransferase [Actinomycetes bacterium]
MTQPIDFRDYEPDDLEVALTIALEAWPEDAAVLPPSFIKAEIELYRALATWTKVAVISEEVVGLLFGQIGRQMDLKEKLQTHLLPAWHLIKLVLGVYGHIPRHFTFLRKYLVTEIRDGRKSPDADGEILLLMVDADSRGLGIGKKLVDNFLAEAKNLGGKSVRVCTDEASN